MNHFLRTIADFMAGSNVWVYVAIFVGKILEVTLSTLRMVLVNRGVRTVGAIVAFVEIALWLVVASTVIVGFRDDYIKGVMYAFAYALGNYLGSWLDEKLALGLSMVQVIVPNTIEAEKLCATMRAKGFGVTLLDVHGRDEDHTMLMMTMKRKRTMEALGLVQEVVPGAVVTVSDVKVEKGSYMRSATKNLFPGRIGK